MRYTLTIVFGFLWIEGDTTLRNLLTEQITHLSIDTQIKSTSPPLSETVSNLFALILSLCKRLLNLNFCQLSEYRRLPISIHNFSSTSCMSSTLSTLKIDVETFHDRLYLLDGRLHCLSTLIIHVKIISLRSATLENTVSIILNYYLLRKPS